MANKKENTTKSFVLRVDAATMDAIEKMGGRRISQYQRPASMDHQRSIKEKRPAKEKQQETERRRLTWWQNASNFGARQPSFPGKSS